MTEVVFPLFGAVFVVACVLPLSALVGKATLCALERRTSGALHDLRIRYVVLTATSLVPLAWFLSAGLHQAEELSSPLACLLDHETAARCFEPVLFTLFLSMFVIARVARALEDIPRIVPSRSSEARALRVRIESLLQAHPWLAGLRGRIEVVDTPGVAIGTHGFLSTTVCVGVAFATSSSDEGLVAALGHESEHVRAHDPLRYAAMHVALALNPFGRSLLAAHAARWHAARELHCDREAVVHGADALALADAIVRAARPGPVGTAGLGATDAPMLRLRVEMLLAFSERPPRACCAHDRSRFPIIIAIVVLVALLPHNAGTGALDVLHVSAEHLASSLIR